MFPERKKIGKSFKKCRTEKHDRSVCKNTGKLWIKQLYIELVICTFFKNMFLSTRTLKTNDMQNLDIISDFANDPAH